MGSPNWDKPCDIGFTEHSMTVQVLEKFDETHIKSFKCPRCGKVVTWIGPRAE